MILALSATYTLTDLGISMDGFKITDVFHFSLACSFRSISLLSL